MDALKKDYPRYLHTLPGPLFETYDTTPKSRIILYPLGFRIFSLPVTGSFQLSFTVLSAIGLKTYLRLEVNTSQLPAQYPMYSTQDTHTSFQI